MVQDHRYIEQCTNLKRLVSLNKKIKWLYASYKLYVPNWNLASWYQNKLTTMVEIWNHGNTIYDVEANYASLLHLDDFW